MKLFEVVEGFCATCCAELAEEAFLDVLVWVLDGGGFFCWGVVGDTEGENC